MKVEDDASAIGGQHGRGAGERGILAEGMVVKMPDVGRAAQRLFCRMPQAFQKGLRGRHGGVVPVSKAVDDPQRQVFGVRRTLTNKNDVFGGWQRGADHLRHAARPEMIVDDGDPHALPLPDQSPMGLMKWKPQISKPSR